MAKRFEASTQRVGSQPDARNIDADDERYDDDWDYDGEETDTVCLAGVRPIETAWVWGGHIPAGHPQRGAR